MKSAGTLVAHPFPLRADLRRSSPLALAAYSDRGGGGYSGGGNECMHAYRFVVPDFVVDNIVDRRTSLRDNPFLLLLLLLLQPG